MQLTDIANVLPPKKLPDEMRQHLLRAALAAARAHRDTSRGYWYTDIRQQYMGTFSSPDAYWQLRYLSGQLSVDDEYCAENGGIDWPALIPDLNRHSSETCIVTKYGYAYFDPYNDGRSWQDH